MTLINRLAPQKRILLRIRANRISFTGNQTYDSQRNGWFYLYEGVNGMVWHCWKDATTGTIERDIELRPGNAEFGPIGGRLLHRAYGLTISDPPRYHIYCIREPDEEKDADRCTMINAILSYKHKGQTNCARIGVQDRPKRQSLIRTFLLGPLANSRLVKPSQIGRAVPYGFEILPQFQTAAERAKCLLKNDSTRSSSEEEFEKVCFNSIESKLDFTVPKSHVSPKKVKMDTTTSGEYYMEKVQVMLEVKNEYDANTQTVNEEMTETVNDEPTQTVREDFGETSNEKTQTASDDTTTTVSGGKTDSKEEQTSNESTTDTVNTETSEALKSSEKTSEKITTEPSEATEESLSTKEPSSTSISFKAAMETQESTASAVKTEEKKKEDIIPAGGSKENCATEQQKHDSKVQPFLEAKSSSRESSSKSLKLWAKGKERQKQCAVNKLVALNKARRASSPAGLRKIKKLQKMKAVQGAGDPMRPRAKSSSARLDQTSHDEPANQRAQTPTEGSRSRSKMRRLSDEVDSLIRRALRPRKRVKKAAPLMPLKSEQPAENKQQTIPKSSVVITEDGGAARQVMTVSAPIPHADVAQEAKIGGPPQDAVPLKQETNPPVIKEPPKATTEVTAKNEAAAQADTDLLEVLASIVNILRLMTEDGQRASEKAPEDPKKEEISKEAMTKHEGDKGEASKERKLSAETEEKTNVRTDENKKSGKVVEN